jgi:hypothetical protein
MYISVLSVDLLHVVLTKYGEKSKRRKFKNRNFKFVREALSVVSCVSISVWSAECFLALNFVKICLPKSKWCPQNKVKFMVVILPSQKGHVICLIVYCVYLKWCDTFRFVERQHVFVEVGQCYGKKWIQYSLELCASWVFLVFLQ